MGVRRGLEVHIDTLVIDDASRADGLRAGEAFRQELVRLFEGARSSPFPMHQAAIDRLEADMVASPSGTRGAALGTAIARAVYQRLVR